MQSDSFNLFTESQTTQKYIWLEVVCKVIFKAYVCVVLHSSLIHAFFSLNLLNSASINVALNLYYFPHIFAFFDTAECWLSAIYYNLTVFRTKLVKWFHYCIP